MEFEGNRFVQYFVGCVQEIDGNIVTSMFMRKQTSSKFGSMIFRFPDEDDVCRHSFEDVVLI